jgi:uncharacterized phiE125 gp8 family phage protein
MAYATLTQVKAYLSITAATDDGLLTDLIGRAQATLEAQMARTFEALADSTKRFDALRDVSDDRRTLYVEPDLCQITSVTNGDGVAVAGTAYTLEPRSAPYYALRLKASSGLTWTYATDPEDAIGIVGRWAYSVSAPADIVQACIRLAAYLYRQRDSGAEMDRAQMSMTGVMMLPSRMPKDVETLIEPYKRRTP